MTRFWPRYRFYGLLLSTLFLGFGLRVFRLGSQSLWNDEGTSIALARLSLPAIIAGSAHDIHPPLYYFFLHFWMGFAGDGEFAVRFLSVLAGVFTVAVAFRVATTLLSARPLESHREERHMRRSNLAQAQEAEIASPNPLAMTVQKPRLARAVVGEVPLLAALLSSISAFQIYYSQETRMYILVTLWCALSVWAMVAFLSVSRHPDQRWRTRAAWLGYIAATAAALYTHYFAFTLVLFENLAFLLWLALESRPAVEFGGLPVTPGPSPQRGEGRLSASPRQRVSAAIAFWIAAQLVIVAAFLPWLAYAGNQLATWPAISQAMSPLELVSRVLSSFALGLDTWTEWQKIILVAYALAFLAGCLPVLGRPGRVDEVWGIAVAALWSIVPVAAMFVVSLQRPAYNDKFLLLATPGFYVLAARGLNLSFSAALRAGSGEEGAGLRPAPSSPIPLLPLPKWRFGLRGVYLILGLVIAVGAVLSVQAVYYDPRLQRDDYRGIVTYINAVAHSEDAVLVDAPGQMDVFRYYYRGAANVLALPIGRPMVEDATRTALEGLVANHRNLYAVYYATEQADPAAMIEQYLSQHAFAAADDWHGNVRLAQYALPRTMDAAGFEITHARFGAEIELDRYSIGARSIPAGSILPLQFDWITLVRPAANYKVFVHLLDGSGAIVSQRDTEPGGGFRPTGAWESGQSVEDNVGLVLAPGMSPGDYALEIGLYRPESGTRLALAGGGDHLVLGSVRVER